jgi:hypothetical protein
MNANQRQAHWSARSTPTKAWRTAAGLYAKQAKVPALGRAAITAVVHRSDRRRDADAHNRYPTVKAAVDGLVDAGVLPDDCDRYLDSLTIRAGEPVDKRKHPLGVLELIIAEVTVYRIEES